MLFDLMGLGWDGILDMMVVQGSYDLIGLWPLFYSENLSVIFIKLWHRIIIPTEVPGFVILTWIVLADRALMDRQDVTEPRHTKAIR